MKVDIEKTRKFGKLIDCYFVSEPLPNFEDGIVYVRNGGEEWQSSFEIAREKISRSKAMEVMNMNYRLQLIDEDEWPAESPFHECKLLLPVSTSDRDGQCYLMVKEVDADALESAASFMITEAHTISEACAEMALANLGFGEDFPDSSEDDVSNIPTIGGPIVGATISFGGMINAIPDAMSFLEKKKERIEKRNLSYQQRITQLKKLPEISKRMRSAEDHEAKQAFAELWYSLTERERGHLCYELLKHSRPLDIKKILRATVSREDIGASSKLSVLIKPITSDKEISLFGLDCKQCTYLKDEKGELYPLKFSPTTQVLYTMFLINRKRNPDATPNLDLLKNKDAFFSVYHAMYHETDASIKKEFDKLFVHETMKKSVHSGNLRSRFYEIENRLVKTFRDLDENPSPYFIKEDMPLAIKHENIELSDSIEQAGIVLKC